MHVRTKVMQLLADYAFWDNDVHYGFMIDDWIQIRFLTTVMCSICLLFPVLISKLCNESMHFDIINTFSFQDNTFCCCGHDIKHYHYYHKPQYRLISIIIKNKKRL